MADREVHTLTSQKGEKGDPIAFHGRSIVFLPAGTPFGKNVRVSLMQVGDPNRRHPLYRGVPAQDVASERWRDNGDGTASRVTVLTDWLGNESEVGAVETRPLVVRETPDSANLRTDRVVVWGADLASSVVLEEEVRTVPTQREVVTQGRLTWQIVSNREEHSAPRSVPVTAMTVTAGLVISSWQRVQYPDSDAVSIRADFGGHHVVDGTTWGKIPVWIRDQHYARFPVCSCGRQRREVQVADDYSKCELCRAGEVCVRCSKKAKVKNLAGRLVCGDCEPYESAEEMIGRLLKQEQRRSLAEEARKLSSGQVLAQAEGEAVLELTVGHVESSSVRQRLLDAWKGYQWYYFTPDGVYGTKLAPAALTILEFLPQASGNGLVELVAWLAVQPKSRNDYYAATQVQGVAMPISQVMSALQASLGGSMLKLADRLRGSEQDRIAALERHRALQQEVIVGRIALRGSDSDAVAAVLKVLQEQEQDYGKAVELLNQFNARHATRAEALASGQIWPDVVIDVSTRSRSRTDVFAISSDGLIIEPEDSERGGRKDRYVAAYHYGDLPNSVLVISHGQDNYGYQYNEDWEVHFLPVRVTEAQKTALQRLRQEMAGYFVGQGTGWDLRQAGTVSFSTAYHRDLQGLEAQSDEEMRANLPIDVTQWERSIPEEGRVIVGPYRRRSREAKAVQEAEDAELNARGLVMLLDEEKQLAQAPYDEAFAAWAERDGVKDGSLPVEEGTVFVVPAFVLEKREGREDFAYGPFFDWASGSQVKLVLDPFSGASQRINEQSREVLVRVRARNGEQVHLFETFLRPAGGGAKVRTFGYFVIPVLSPADYDQQIAEADKAHRAAVEELERARQAEDYARQIKRAEQEAIRTVAEVPTTYHSTDPNLSLGPMAAALAAALQKKNG